MLRFLHYAQINGLNHNDHKYWIARIQIEFGARGLRQFRLYSQMPIIETNQNPDDNDQTSDTSSDASDNADNVQFFTPTLESRHTTINAKDFYHFLWRPRIQCILTLKHEAKSFFEYYGPDRAAYSTEDAQFLKQALKDFADAMHDDDEDHRPKDLVAFDQKLALPAAVIAQYRGVVKLLSTNTMLSRHVTEGGIVHHAAHHRLYELVTDLVVSHKVNIDSLNGNNHRTALSELFYKDFNSYINQEKMILLLLELGSDPRITDCKGKTILHYINEDEATAIEQEAGQETIAALARIKQNIIDATHAKDEEDALARARTTIRSNS